MKMVNGNLFRHLKLANSGAIDSKTGCCFNFDPGNMKPGTFKYARCDFQAQTCRSAEMPGLSVFSVI